MRSSTATRVTKLQNFKPGGEGGPTFDLYATINHRGASSRGGHYWARALVPGTGSPPEGRWWEFNDSDVKDESGAIDDMRKLGYIHFYKRRP